MDWHWEHRTSKPDNTGKASNEHVEVAAPLCFIDKSDIAVVNIAIARVR